jgi:flavin-dependent dehydrogenase
MSEHDVVILGGGLAGLSLARHLLLHTERTVLLIERREEIPPRQQKVGESLVQVGGYYFSKVLDLEPHLLEEHLMKYNLRFYWKSAGRDNDGLEDFSQGYIRNFSNVASYQLDRNRFEAEVLRLNREHPRFRCVTGVKDLQVDLVEEDYEVRGNGNGHGNGTTPDDALHRVRFGGEDVAARWVVDATGRNRFLAKRRKLGRPSSIRHGAFFWWVDGMVDVERLTDLSSRERRLHPHRRHQGHLPLWLATNHFMGEGFWFWVIPLRGKTSLGLVFDTQVINTSDVFSVDKATDWVCREFPLFARDLPQREVLDFGGFRSFSHDCARTISPRRWAMTGEAGRFTDPLYSPGSDLIAVYNSLIVDAMETDRRGGHQALVDKCALYENMMRAVFTAYVPSYATSYDALGDPEVFALKYSFELATYAVAYVFPFVNDLFTDRRFAFTFLRQFSRLGPINRTVHSFLSGYFQWKKEHLLPLEEPVFLDFSSIPPLGRCEKIFYEVGVSLHEARRVLDEYLEHVVELARFVVAHAASVVVGDPRRPHPPRLCRSSRPGDGDLRRRRAAGAVGRGAGGEGGVGLDVRDGGVGSVSRRGRWFRFSFQGAPHSRRRPLSAH